MRPIGSYTGIPNHKELKPPSWVNELRNEPNKPPAISTDEKIIMDSTGATIIEVKHLMKEMNNDMDAVIEYLIAVKQAEQMEQTNYQKEQKSATQVR